MNKTLESGRIITDALIDGENVFVTNGRIFKECTPIKYALHGFYDSDTNFYDFDSFDVIKKSDANTNHDNWLVRNNA